MVHMLGLQVELAIELGDDLQPVRGAVSLDLTARDVQAGAGGGRMHATCDARLWCMPGPEEEESLLHSAHGT